MIKQHKMKLRLFAAIIAILCHSVILLPEDLCAAENMPEPALELSEEEQAFIAEKKELTIGCTVDNCPLTYQDEDTGEIKGITIDILNMISESTGLTFRYQALPPGDIKIADLQRLQVDMVASVEYHEINEHALGIVMTDPYLHAEKVFVCKKGVLFEPDKEMVIGVTSGSQTLANIIQKKFPNFHVTAYDSTEDLLSALLSGEVDAALQNQYSIERLLAKPLYEDLQVVAAASISDSHCLGAMVPITEDRENMISDETALLLSVLNKGIANLDKSEVSFCIIQETAENTYKLTLWDMLYRYRYAAVILSISSLLIIFLLWWNYILHRKRMEQSAAEKRAKELAAINAQLHEQKLLLTDALERAKEGSKAKTAFLFNMSHDIRTPMNAILGFTTIAYHNRDNMEKLTDALEKIEESGKHLLLLINKILDMSKIESGKVKLTEHPCNLVESIEKVRDILQTEMDKKDLKVTIDVAEVKDAWVYCDKLRVDQILFNLLSNAGKFSKNGGVIAIALRQNPSDMEDYATYELRVQDHGIGMSPEFQSHIFEPFERERTSTISKTQGTGLGMSITKSLVDLMGGTIEVKSELDHGTEFILHFTFKIHEDIPQTEEPAIDETSLLSAFSGRRLLVVEDNNLNREIVQELLSEKGLIIETAENGQLAVEMVRNSAPGYYDAVLMDIQMPVMDGYTATREIRKLETKELADIPVIALTANAFNEDKKEALENGMNAHLAKPLDIRALHETLAKLLPPQ